MTQTHERFSFMQKLYISKFLAGSNPKSKKVSFFRKLSRSKEAAALPPRGAMLHQPSMEMALRELTHPTHSDQLKNQQQVTFKLVKTGEY